MSNDNVGPREATPREVNSLLGVVVGIMECFKCGPFFAIPLNFDGENFSQREVDVEFCPTCGGPAFPRAPTGEPTC
jgi:hypothetical protein